MPTTTSTGPHPLPRRGVGRLWFAALLVALAACGEPPALEVGPVDYTAEELGVLGPSQQEMLTQITAFGLTVANGRVQELIGPFVQADLRSMVLQREAMEIAVNDAGMDEAELRRAYEEHPRQELVVRHLVVLSERWRPQAHRDSARARAQEALERARAGEDFEKLVAEYSDEPGAAERGGLLKPGREGSWVPEFWEAASSLREGEISDVVETEFGFHVIRLEERRAVPFEEARDEFLETFVDLPQALGRATEWVTDVQSVMRVDTPAIRAWMDGADTVGPLVTWPDSLAIPAYTADELERYGETSRQATPDELRAMQPAELLDMVTGAARTHIMVARARQEGVEPSESQRAAVQQRWEQQVAGWATALGFREGMSTSAVKAGALEALGAQAQSAALARSKLPRLAAGLKRLYPITWPAESR